MPVRTSRIYYASGTTVYKRPIHTRAKAGTEITVGFPVCVVTNFIGPEGAVILAMMLNLAEKTSRDLAKWKRPRPSRSTAARMQRR